MPVNLVFIKFTLQKIKVEQVMKKRNGTGLIVLYLIFILNYISKFCVM